MRMNRTGRALRVAGIAAAVVALRELSARLYFARTPGPTEQVHTDERTAWTVAGHETWAVAELLALRASPVYRGDGVPHGDGAPVVLVAGFLASGAYLEPLRAWLERIGYRARVADIGWNVDCLEVLTDRLIADLRADHATANRPAHLVGHSLGGIIARSAAVRAEPIVASVATIASPFRGVRGHPLLRAAASLVRSQIHTRRPEVPAECHTLACPCPSVRAVHEPIAHRIARLAIVATRDGLVDPRYCREDGDGHARTTEVAATHLGSVVNVETYRALAGHLAGAGRLLAAGTTAAP